jgi:hypothetical protein
LNDIVYVGYNHKNKSRFQARREEKGKSFDPLVIQDFSWDNEWVDATYVHPQGARGCDNENGLTWGLVDDAVGASSSLRGRNFPRSASRKGARIPVVVEDEDGSTDGDGEEEEDPHDDADVTDSEDAPNGSNDSGQIAVPKINEFEDGH